MAGSECARVTQSSNYVALWLNMSEQGVNMSEQGVNMSELSEFTIIFFSFFFNWDSPHASLNSHYEAWSYKKKAQKRLQDIANLFAKNLQLKDVC